MLQILKDQVWYEKGKYFSDVHYCGIGLFGFVGQVQPKLSIHFADCILIPDVKVLRPLSFLGYLNTYNSCIHFNK